MRRPFPFSMPLRRRRPEKTGETGGVDQRVVTVAGVPDPDVAASDPRNLGVQFDLLVSAARREYAILSLSAGGYVTSWNDGAEAIKGYTASEIIGRHFSLFYPPEDVAAGVVENELVVAARTGSIEVEGWRLRKDGSRFWANVVITAVFDEDNGELIGFGKVTRDMTERKRFIDALQEARTVADQASLAKDEFLSSMSHELRTPLNAVIGFSQVLESGPLTDEQLEAVAHIGQAGHHLLAIINEVLDFARVTAGHAAVHAESAAIAGTVDEAIALVQVAAAEAGVIVGAHGPHDLAALADRQRLRQVVLNLLSNAVKYNRPGGDVTVTWGAAAPGRVQLRVADTGRGISAELLARLFVPFDRLDADVATAREGSGLGLAVSQSLLGAMGGTIAVTSEPGRGTTFTVDLPGAPAAVAAPDRPEPPAVPDPSSPLRVLYIEDDPSNLRLVQHIFRARPGIELIAAARGRVGLELARSLVPDLVLLDLTLPDVPGEQVLRELQADPATAEVPVVVMSADASPDRMASLQAMGAVDYLTKPLDVAGLLEVADRSPRSAVTARPAAS
jgi:PAS domain S-box-containing protein